MKTASPDQTAQWLEETRSFGRHYDYDITWMEDLLERSPEAFEAFRGAMAMSGLSRKAPVELAAIARLAALRVEDCGPCLLLSVKMAREAGVSEAVIRGTLKGGEGLEGEALEVFRFARAVAANEPIDEPWRQELETRLGLDVIAELGVVIAGVRIYPTLKRALGHAKSCSLMPELDVR